MLATGLTAVLTWYSVHIRMLNSEYVGVYFNYNVAIYIDSSKFGMYACASSIKLARSAIS